MARPKLDIDPELVKKLASRACKVEEIADFFECDAKTLYNRFSAELKKGKADLKLSLRQKQIEVALNGNITMLIWLGKQMLGQVDKMQFDIREVDDETLAIEAKRRLSERRTA